MYNDDWMDPEPEEKVFSMYCCECDSHLGMTECEITATSPTMCNACHLEHLREFREVEANL